MLWNIAIFCVVEGKNEKHSWYCIAVIWSMICKACNTYLWYNWVIICGELDLMLFINSMPHKNMPMFLRAFTLSTIWCCCIMTFTWVFCAKMFCMTTFTFCSVRRLNVRSLVLKLDIAHFVQVIWMSDRWAFEVSSIHCTFCPMVLLSPAQLNSTNLYEFERIYVHIGEKGSLVLETTLVRNDVQPSFHYTFTTFTL